MMDIGRLRAMHVGFMEGIQWAADHPEPEGDWEQFVRAYRDYRRRDWEMFARRQGADATDYNVRTQRFVDERRKELAAIEAG